MSKDDFRLPLVDEATEPIEVVEALSMCVVGAVYRMAVGEGAMRGRDKPEDTEMVTAGVCFLCRLLAGIPQDQLDHILKVLRGGEKPQQEQQLKDPGGVQN